MWNAPLADLQLNPCKWTVTTETIVPADAIVRTVLLEKINQQLTVCGVTMINQF